MTKEKFIKEVEQDCEYLEIDLTEETYLCTKCGSPDIDEQRWVGVNTGLVNEIIDEDEIWCNNCSQKVEMEQYATFLKEKLYENL